MATTSSSARETKRARRPTAAELGGGRVTGATNERAAAGADLVVLAVKAGAALDTARGVAGALGTTPLLSVASAIEFRKGVGMLPDPDAASLAERVQAVVDAPVVAGLHSIAAASLEASPPDEDALICGDDGGRRSSRSRSPGGSSAAVRSTRAPSPVLGRSRA